MPLISDGYSEVALVRPKTYQLLSDAQLRVEREALLQISELLSKAQIIQASSQLDWVSKPLPPPIQ